MNALNAAKVALFFEISNILSFFLLKNAQRCRSAAFIVFFCLPISAFFATFAENFCMMKKVLTLVLCFTAASVMAQSLNKDYLAYIEAYKQVAVNQEIIYKIPACITLAQGLLESGAGKSTLATEANNHFGIKCHSDWTGGTFHKDDDKVNECFRSYASAAESYEDHSLFLLRPRYQKLFALDIRDYKGWARGLRECGYATDPGYAPKLIKIIEDYDLLAVADEVRFSKESKKVEKEVAAADATAGTAKTKDKKAADKAKSRKQKASKKDKAKRTVNKAFNNVPQEPDEQVDQSFKDRKINPSQVASVDMYVGHKVYRQGIRKYVIAEPGDTYSGIAAEFNIELSRILRYNGVSDNAHPTAEQRVYINLPAPKNNPASKKSSVSKKK